MGTRSLIGRRNGDGTIRAIYCHWGGYVEEPGVGSQLAMHYTEAERIDTLIALGDISSLGIHPTDTVAYARDRGEDYETVKARRYADVADYQRAADSYGAEYIYMWDAREGWYVQKVGLPGFPRLADVLNGAKV